MNSLKKGFFADFRGRGPVRPEAVLPPYPAVMTAFGPVGVIRVLAKADGPWRVRCPRNCPPNAAYILRFAPHSAQKVAVGVRSGFPQLAEDGPYSFKRWCMSATGLVSRNPVRPSYTAKARRPASFRYASANEHPVFSRYCFICSNMLAGLTNCHSSSVSIGTSILQRQQ